MFIPENENERLILDQFYQWNEKRLFDPVNKPLTKWEMNLLKEIGRIKRNKIKNLLKLTF